MYVFEEMIEGKKLTEIINTTHENVKYLPGHKLPENIVSSWKDLLQSYYELMTNAVYTQVSIYTFTRTSFWGSAKVLPIDRFINCQNLFKSESAILDKEYHKLVKED